MTLDNFFARSPKLVWEEEQARLKAAEEQKRLDELRKALAAKRQGTKKQAAPATPPASSTNPADFGIETLTDGYKISGVQLDGLTCTYDLCQNPLPSRTQDQHAEHAKNAKPDEYRACSAPLAYALCKTLYDNKDGSKKELVEQARASLCGIIGPNKPWINTLSRVEWKANGLDKIIHDYGLATSHEINAALIGPDGNITNKGTNAEEYAQKILETENTVDEINTIFKWVTGKDVRAYRFNQTPEKDSARAVVLGVDYDDTFNLNANDYLSYGGPALGVRSAKNFSKQ